MGLSCMVILYLLKLFKGKWSTMQEDDSIGVKFLRKTLWFVATGAYLRQDLSRLILNVTIPKRFVN